MMSVAFVASVFALFSFTPALAATYVLSDEIIGSDFYNVFDWDNIPDPTHGRVTYVDQSDSESQNLTFASSDSFILRTDFLTVLTADGPGRNSVRIKSQKTYTTHVVAFDVRHMPEGCGTWPAIWETNNNWPTGGEVDIVEGVNDQSPNRATLHTSPGCTMPSFTTQTGTSAQRNCDTSVDSNAGCGVEFPTPNSYGPSFNSNGGGWFAMERTNSFINVWFWARTDSSVPSDLVSGASTVDPSNWGTPTAAFPDTSCNIPEFFDEHNIIINLTLCGDFAGSTFSQDGCPGDTCDDFVNNNPAAFENAFFDIASIHVWVPST